MKERVQDILDLTGEIFENPRPDLLPNVLVTHSIDQARAWMFTDEVPGVDGDDESGRVWLDLREAMFSEILGRVQEPETHSAYKALDEELESPIYVRIRDTLPSELADFKDDIAADLLNAALARVFAAGEQPDQFFGLLLDAYKAGVLPCGWEGEYPAGRLAVYVPQEH